MRIVTEKEKRAALQEARGPKNQFPNGGKDGGGAQGSFVLMDWEIRNRNRPRREAEHETKVGLDLSVLLFWAIQVEILPLTW